MPGQGTTSAFGERGETAVRGVNVHPHPVLRTDVGDRRKRVDTAAIGRPGGGRHEDGAAPVCDICVDRTDERVGAHRVIVVDGDHAQLIRTEAEDPSGARERRVRLVRHVRDDVVGHRPDGVLAGGGERRHVCRRAAADEHTGSRVGQTQPVREPSQHHQLDLARPGRFHPRAAVDVDSGGEEIAERRGPRAVGRDEREVAGVLAA